MKLTTDAAVNGGFPYAKERVTGSETDWHLVQIQKKVNRIHMKKRNRAWKKNGWLVLI